MHNVKGGNITIMLFHFKGRSRGKARTAVDFTGQQRLQVATAPEGSSQHPPRQLMV